MKTITHKEQIVTFKDFRLDAQKYIDAIGKGASFLVMKRSRPVFRMEPVGEQWETIGDFTSMKGGGVSAKKLLKILRRGR